jgi:hypothetical protein
LPDSTAHPSWSSAIWSPWTSAGIGELVVGLLRTGLILIIVAIVVIVGKLLLALQHVERPTHARQQASWPPCSGRRLAVGILVGVHRVTLSGLLKDQAMAVFLCWD